MLWLMPSKLHANAQSFREQEAGASPRWLRAQSDARRHCLGTTAAGHLPAPGTPPAWLLIAGLDQVRSALVESLSTNSCVHQQRYCALCEQAQAVQLLHWHCDWALEENHPATLLLSALWLHSTAAKVDKPLSAATASQLRSLLRKCAQARSKVDPADDALPVLNLCIAVAGYFGQDQDTVYLCREHHL